jgi:hypothetical protein
MSAHEAVLAELQRRELPVDDYLQVWEEQNLLPPRDLPNAPPPLFNEPARWWEFAMGRPVPALTGIDNK